MFKTSTTSTAKVDQAKCSEKIVAKVVLYYNTKQGNTKIVLQHSLIHKLRTSKLYTSKGEFNGM